MVTLIVNFCNFITRPYAPYQIYTSVCRVDIFKKVLLGRSKWIECHSYDTVQCTRQENQYSIYFSAVL